MYCVEIQGHCFSVIKWFTVFNLYYDSSVRQTMTISFSVINFKLLMMHLNTRAILLVHFFLNYMTHNFLSLSMWWHKYERERRPEPVTQFPYLPCNSDFPKLNLAMRILCASSYYSPALVLNTSHRVLRTLTLFYSRLCYGNKSWVKKR